MVVGRKAIMGGCCARTFSGDAELGLEDFGRADSGSRVPDSGIIRVLEIKCRALRAADPAVAADYSTLKTG